MAQFNKTLGKFQLVDLPPAPRGVPQIEVTLRHRRQRHRARVGQGPGHRQGAVDDDHRPVDARQGRHRPDGHATPRPTPRRTAQRREEAEVRNKRRHARLPDREGAEGPGRARSPADEQAAVEQPLAELKTALAGNDTAAIKDGRREKLMSRQPGVQPEALRARARDANAAGTSAPRPGRAPSGAGTVDDAEIVDAEIVDDETRAT